MNFEMYFIYFVRDDYVRINEANITPGKEGNFDKKNPSDVLTNGAYDYSASYTAIISRDRMQFLR